MESVEGKAVDGEKVYNIIEQVRRETHLSYKLASHVVCVVLDNLAVITPTAVTSVIDKILKELEIPLEVSDRVLDGTEDMERLLSITENLHAVRNDAQQRSWELFDDQATIMESLTEFESRLANADIAIVQRFLQIIDYGIVSCLAEYYQMESRWPIKMIILKIIDLLCALSRTSVKILLGTVLPLELTRDIELHHRDNSKLFACISVLIKLFAIREPLPVIYFDSINKNFILFLLNLIETPTDDEDQEKKITQLIYFILVYNLQFDDRERKLENVVIIALEEAENPKIFSETLLLLFNRGNDPVKLLDYQPCSLNSLLKMITDIFSNDKASCIFYKNDVKVLIDIVLRQLTDDPPISQENTQWLKLVKQILARTEKSVYLDRLDDIEFCVSRISSGVDTKEETKLLMSEILDHISNCR